MKVSNKKEDFLQESLKLIHEKGFKATTMRDIAERMNFDVSNSYNYIKSKHEILEGFLFGTSAEFHSAMDNVLSSSYSPDEKLKQIISSHITIASTKPFEVALMVNEWRNLKEPKYTEYIKLRDSYEEKLGSLLLEGIEMGVFKAFDITIAKSVILSSLRWFYDSYATNNPNINPIELERQIVSFLFKGFLE
ncbi:TetR/AcrR family transcriptional regulator [Maribacter algarum]|uniref:TetR/AcrR family transcriptional regulator n=1 Tax=Maribacter algarum (ex Zhang et al. 2020) TaxID=2578118 RepID=A0A5S3PMV9_9FLAO|nr:TetR family transcriptional regulator [Maribacter algarum]TMM55804.1 TetR/AcrR family transcriptional regulator [Maribacter algarum]